MSENRLGGTCKLHVELIKVELIKPSHYDQDGYVLQWWKAWIPSNSLACLYGPRLDLAEKKALGENVEIAIDAYDEMNIVIPFKELVRRIARADGTKPVRIWQNVLQIHGAMGLEGVHPQQCGYVRRKLLSQRRYGLPKENPLIFVPRRIRETLSTYASFGWYAWSLHRLRKRVQRDPAAKTYSDPALAPVAAAE